jgi:L-methionine (R)-S-oxide reductase
MSESIPDLRSIPRAAAYATLKENTALVLAGVSDEIAAMATISALLYHSLGFLWVGFYRVTSPGILQVGPYQGSLGCLEIKFGAGVCGTAAAEKKTVIVADVEKFPGHIACDARSRSEIVVPVLNRKAELIAVLDIDSESVGTFSEADKNGLEDLLQWFKCN